MLCQVHHTFQPIQSDLWRCIHTGECQVWMFFRSLISRKSEFFFWASRNPLPRWTGSSNENLWSGISYEITSWKKKEEAASVWSTIRDEFARIKGRKRRQGSPWIKAAGTIGHKDGSTATWSLGFHGPGSFDDKIGIRDVDFILSQVLRMNMCEVPSFYGSRVSTTTLGLWIGSIAFGKSPTCQPMTSLSEFIAKQVLCQPSLCSR